MHKTSLTQIYRNPSKISAMRLHEHYRYLRRKKAIAHFASQKRGPALSERGLQLLLLHNSSSCLQVYKMSAGDKIDLWYFVRPRDTEVLTIYSRDPQIGTPNFGKPPYLLKQPRGEMIHQQAGSFIWSWSCSSDQQPECKTKGSSRPSSFNCLKRTCLRV